MERKVNRLRRLLCAVGWHQNIGVAIGNYIRCYACGRNLHPVDNTWHFEPPPDLRTNEERDADELRRILEDLTTANWNADNFIPLPEYDAAMVALGYRKEGVFWG